MPLTGESRVTYKGPGKERGKGEEKEIELGGRRLVAPPSSGCLEALAQAYSLKEAGLVKKTVGRLEISWDYLKEGELKDKKER